MSTQTIPPAPAPSRPRRRSIFTGLLLVTVGVLFLLRNFGWHYGLWSVIGRWWPVLLIIWGLSKLYDHMVAQRTGQAPPRTVTGGEVFLVILVLALLSGGGLFDYARLHPDDFSWGDNDRVPWAHTYTYNEEVPAKAVPASTHITIETDYGDVTVHPEDAAQIRASVKKEIGGWDQSEAEKRGQQVKVTIEQAGDGFNVQTEGQSSGDGHARVDLDVYVPKRASITVRSGKGNLQIIGQGGNVTVETRKGDVEVRDAGGDVSVDLNGGDTHIIGASGNVKLSGHGSQVTMADVKGEASVEGEFFGPIRIEKPGKGMRFLSKRSDISISELTGRFAITSGRLEVVDAPGNVSVSTSSNDISVENPGGRVHVENRNGNVEIRFAKPPQDQIDVIDSNGHIDLTLPGRSTFEVHATSHSGEISSDFSDLQQHNTSGNATLDGKLGAKGPAVNLKTTYGAIRLRKGE
jgi:DUF4097 and DUF4098 domain-containing protein YvlB